MNTKLSNFIEKNNYNFILIMILYALCGVFFPYTQISLLFGNSQLSKDIIFVIVKLVISIFPIYVYFKYIKFLDINYNFKNNILLFCLILVCINNIPICSFLTGDIKIILNKFTFIFHTLKCISISIFEEFIFRGIILVMLYKNLKKHKFTYSIVFSSLIFALFHLANVFSGEELWYVLFQSLYSILTGCIFGLAFALTKKISTPIILHFIYNFGGLLQDNEIIIGIIWTTWQVVITTILGVIVGIYALNELIKIYKKGN